MEVEFQGLRVYTKLFNSSHFLKYTLLNQVNPLTLPVLIPDEEKKLTEIFIFTLLCGSLKSFMNEGLNIDLNILEHFNILAQS